METIQTNDVKVIIKSIGTEGILMRDTKEFTEKGEEIKTTEYFLDVNSENTTGENAQFIAVEGDPEVNDDAQFVAVEVSDSDHIILHEKEVILWNELCRICANGSDRFIPIFSGEGLDHNLCNKINTYLPLEVSINDTLPLHICYNCAATLLAWHDMFKGCFDAQQRLTELQTKLKDQYYNDSAMEETTENVLEVESENCGMPKDDEKTVNNDEIVEVDDPDSERCLSLENYEIVTIVASTPDDDPSYEKPQRALNVKKRSMDKAQRAERRLEAARAKILVEGAAYYQCPMCPKVLTTAYNYLAHRRVHTREKVFTCEQCGRSFTTLSSLTRHVRDVHDKIKAYTCTYCERKLASRLARDEHERTHTDERPCVCEICGKSFRQRASLSVHKRFHSRDYLFNCSYCKRGFPRKQDMERHELTHTNEKPYGCEVCGKFFRSSASAIRHRQSHGDGKFICDICGDSFTIERYLKSHIKKMHKDECDEDVACIKKDQ